MRKPEQIEKKLQKAILYIFLNQNWVLRFLEGNCVLQVKMATIIPKFMIRQKMHLVHKKVFMIL